MTMKTYWWPPWISLDAIVVFPIRDSFILLLTHIICPRDLLFISWLILFHFMTHPFSFRDSLFISWLIPFFSWLTLASHDSLDLWYFKFPFPFWTLFLVITHSLTHSGAISNYWLILTQSMLLSPIVLPYWYILSRDWSVDFKFAHSSLSTSSHIVIASSIVLHLYIRPLATVL